MTLSLAALCCLVGLVGLACGLAIGSWYWANRYAAVLECFVAACVEFDDEEAG